MPGTFFTLISKKNYLMLENKEININTLVRETKTDVYQFLLKTGFAPDDILPVVGEPGRFRLTVGSYRALFRYRDDHIFITHLDPRGQVYNKKNKGAKR